MEHTELKAIIESLVFVAQEPLTTGALALMLGEAGIEKAAIQQALDEIAESYERDASRGVTLAAVAGGYEFRTKDAMAPWVGKLNLPKPTKLSQAALETLAIIAYQQPVTRAEIEEIRGVDCGGVLRTLLERNLSRIVGKKEEPGSPLTYGTTKEFLALFSLQGLTGLPSLRDFHELAAASAENVAGDEATASAPAAAPVAPIDPAVQVELARTDQAVIDELEAQIRSLRHLERNVFPQTAESDAIDALTQALTDAAPSPATDDASANVVQ